MTSGGKLADHPVAAMLGAGTGVLGLVALAFTPAGLMLVAGGAALLFWHRLRPSAVGSAVAAAAGAVAGTLGTLPVRTVEVCCMFGWSEERGWPYAWLARWATADTPEQARALAIAAGWQLDPYPVYLITDVIFWAYAGFLLFVVSGLAVRAYRTRRHERLSRLTP